MRGLEILDGGGACRGSVALPRHRDVAATLPRTMPRGIHTFETNGATVPRQFIKRKVVYIFFLINCRGTVAPLVSKVWMPRGIVRGNVAATSRQRGTVASAIFGVRKMDEFLDIDICAHGPSRKRPIWTVCAHVDRSLNPYGTPNLCSKQLRTISNASRKVNCLEASKNDQK